VSHVVESAASRRHRRNRRTAIVLIVVAAALAAAFYYAASYLNRPRTPAATDCPTTDITAGAPAALSPGQVTVNVYNATNRAGLAADTAKNVKARGFVVAAVANDPAKKKIDGVGEVRFGPNGKPGAELVVALLDGVTPLQDTRADASVDLVLGNGFKALNPAPTTTSAPPASAAPC
jgi:hypothetical protein